jgi:hypothetical protein
VNKHRTKRLSAPASGPLSGDPGDGYRVVALVRPRWESRGKAEGPAAIGELRARQRKRVAAIRKLNARYAGQAFPMRAAEKWNRLSRELDETEELITELRARYEAHRGA